MHINCPEKDNFAHQVWMWYSEVLLRSIDPSFLSWSVFNKMSRNCWKSQTIQINAWSLLKTKIYCYTWSLLRKWLAWSRNVWFNSTCYHPPGHTPGDLPFFPYWAVYSPAPGTQKETIPHPRDSPFVTHRTHTQKRNNAAFCVQNQDNNIYFCAKACHKHTRKHAEDSNSTPKPMFHYNSRFCRFVRCISVLLLV